VRRTVEARILTAMSHDEIVEEATSIYDSAKVVVIEMTDVPTMDASVPNHRVRTVDASRLQGAEVIVTGLSPQGGMEEAERLL
jgi:anti-anti-sigma regulatory factor